MKYLLLFICLTASLSSTPYLIHRESPGGGFWANFIFVLNGIDEADKRGWTPVVDMERHPTRYSESQPIFGTMNAWEYFFEQPGGLSVKEALKLDYQEQLENSAQFTGDHAIQPPVEKVARAKELIKKYIRIKQPLLDEMDGIIPPGLHENILGVHVRGTDRRQGIYKNHLLTDGAGTYLEKAQELDRVHHFSYVYLACDETETVEMFKEAFGERLLAIDVFRVSAETVTRKNYNWLFEADRENHRYLLGREVLMDALLLSRAGHLLCGPSNVSLASIFFAAGEQVIHEVASPGMAGRKPGVLPWCKALYEDCDKFCHLKGRVWCLTVLGGVFLVIFSIFKFKRRLRVL